MGLLMAVVWELSGGPKRAVVYVIEEKSTCWQTDITGPRYGSWVGLVQRVDAAHKNGLSTGALAFEKYNLVT